MNSLIEIGLVNAILATGLAGLVAFLSKKIRRPALAHALWILVLVQLVTPPFVEIPIGYRFDMSRLISIADSDSARAITNPVFARDTMASRSVRLSAQKDHERSTAGSSANSRTASSTATASASRLELRASASASEKAWLSPAIWFSVAIRLWLAGTILWFVALGMRIICFNRKLRYFQRAPAELQQQAERLAVSMGLAQSPSILIVHEPISPMLWACGIKAKLLFPAALLRRIDRSSRATLIVHELAHYRRGDHWVRRLEFLVCGLYWWHPVVWWARREIENAEESCCDAWVVGHFPKAQRQYAEALLDTIDFLCETPVKLPLMGSGIGHVNSIRKRLTAIMLDSTPKKLTNLGRVAILVTAFLLLPFRPGLFKNQNNKLESARTAMPSRHPGRVAAQHAKVPGTTEKHRQQSGTQPLQSGLSNRTGTGTSQQADRNGRSPAGPVVEIRNRSLEVAQRSPQNEIWATATSPDGRKTISTKTDCRVEFRNAATGLTVDLSGFEITKVAFSPTAPLFATGDWDGTVRLWHASTAEQLTNFEGHTGAVRSVAFSPDGRLLVSAGGDGQVRLWTVADKNEVGERLVPACMPIMFSDPVDCVRFAPNGKSLAVATEELYSHEPGRVQLWDLDSLTESMEFRCKSPVGAVSFRPDGTTLVVGEQNGRVTIWNLLTQTRLVTGPYRKSAISSAAFSPNIRTLSHIDTNSVPDDAVTTTEWVPEQTGESMATPNKFVPFAVY